MIATALAEAALRAPALSGKAPFLALLLAAALLTAVSGAFASFLCGTGGGKPRGPPGSGKGTALCGGLRMLVLELLAARAEALGSVPRLLIAYGKPHFRRDRCALRPASRP